MSSDPRYQVQGVCSIATARRGRTYEIWHANSTLEEIEKKSEGERGERDGSSSGAARRPFEHAAHATRAESTRPTRERAMRASAAACRVIACGLPTILLLLLLLAVQLGVVGG